MKIDDEFRKDILCNLMKFEEYLKLNIILCLKIN
jgi:hypothetical protein